MIEIYIRKYILLPENFLMLNINQKKIIIKKKEKENLFECTWAAKIETTNFLLLHLHV